MWWWTLVALAEDPQMGSAVSHGRTLSIAGEILALSSLPVLVGGATGLTLAAVRNPSEYAQSPLVEISYLGVGMAGVGVPLVIAGGEIEASARRKAGQTTPSHKDTAAWATYGVAFATLAVGLPVSASVIKTTPMAGPIIVGSTGLVSTTLWLCAAGLGSDYRGSLRATAPVSLNFVPTGRGVALVGRF